MSHIVQVDIDENAKNLDLNALESLQRLEICYGYLPLIYIYQAFKSTELPAEMTNGGPSRDGKRKGAKLCAN